MRGLPLLLLALAVRSLVAQTSTADADQTGWTHRSWTIEDGLPQNTVTAITQTPDGYLWIGTVKGLARFDGSRFVGYEVANTEGLVGDRVTTLLVDSRGDLWIGTEQVGVSLYSNGSFLDLVERGHVVAGYVYDFEEGVDGDIWMAVRGHLYRRAGRSVSEIPIEFDGRSAVATAVHLDVRGRLWIGTNRGLTRWQDGRVQKVELSGLPESTLRDISDDGDGGLWLLFSSGLGRLNGERFRFTPFGPQIGQTLFRDRTGRVWVSLVGHGPLQIIADSLSDEAIPEALKGAFVRDFFEDDSGLIWIAGGDDGLHLLREPLFEAYTPQSGLPGGSVFRVHEDSIGGIWTATLSEGLLRFSDGRFQRFSTDQGLPGPHVGVMAVTESGRPWAVSRGRPWRLTGNRFEPVSQPPDRDDPSGLSVFGMARRGLGGIWLAGNGWLRYHDDSGYSDPITVNELRGTGVVEMFEVSGSLWFSPSIGLICRLNGRDYACFGTEKGLPRTAIRDLYEHSDETYWLGTYGGGLCQLRKGRAGCLSTEHGLPDNTVHRIIEDPFGFLWLSSNRGVSRLRRVEIERFFAGEVRTVRPDVFTELDGMPSRECNIGGLLAGDGTIWFPTMKGLAKLDPRRALSERPRIPDIQIEEVTIDGESVHEAALGNLPAGSHRVEIRYTGIDFGNPAAVRFRTRLSGHSDEWMDAGGRRVAVFTNLPSGAYAFEVQAAAGSSNWSRPARVSFGIEPFYYETWWFRVLVAFGFIGLLFIAYRERVRRVIERERLAKTEAEAKRLAELDAAKSWFFANISHEFRTPLTLIISPIEDALAGDDLPESDRKRYEMVLDNARHLLDLIDKLLDLSRLDAGRFELKPSDGELVSFVRDLVRRFLPFAERRQVELHFRSGLDVRYGTFDHDRVQSILGNLLSNALKYTPEGGKVWVTLTERDDDEIEFVVKDTGAGISGEQLEYVFERYQRGADELGSGSIGSGIGLALAKELVGLHGGVMLVESEEGFGTAFIVRLPIRRPASRPAIGASPHTPEVRSEVELEEPPSAKAESITRASESDLPLVLVVEDNEEVRALITEQLSEDFLVISASHGMEGLSKVRAHKPDLVLTDVMMPGLDGVELCRKVKSDPQLSHIPVVMLTAKAGDEHALEALNAGAEDYIAKPYHAEGLRKKLTHLIEVRAALRKQYSRELVVPSTGAVVEASDEQFVRRVLELIQARLGDSNFHVEELAAEIGLSRRQLSRRVKATVGEAPSDLIHRMRLERAAELLRSRAGTVSEVAYRVGFKSPSHFGAAFKEAYGHTPGEHIESGT